MSPPAVQFPPPRRGFSLVLSMVVMAMMVMVVVVLAAFLKVESSLAATKQAETQARLNALGAVRLAGAALQERLGPDTRVSAPASLYDDPAVSAVAMPGADPFEYPVLGVWRSWEGNDHDIRTGSRYAGRPQKPDYAAKLTPFNVTTAPTARFLGWMLSSQMGYGNAAFAMPNGLPAKPPAPPLVVSAAGTVPLVGSATDAQPVRQVHAAPIGYADGTTTNGSQGFFSWWVGGENQKVRLIIPNVAPTATGTNLDWAQRARTFGAPDLEAVGYPSLVANAVPMPANQPPSTASVPLLPALGNLTRLTDALKNATPVPLAKAGFHDVSLHAEGLLTNTATGGLRKDLSLFTETWDWANVLDSGRQGKMPLFRLKPAKLPRNSGDPDYDLAFQRPLPDGQMPGGIGNRRRHALMYWWSDYGSLGGASAGVASDGGTNFGGYAALSSFPPIRSWAYLTDYCLHYRKYATGNDPQLAGVTTMLPPQPVTATNAGDLYSYYERIHRHPLIARIQYVFASSASGATPAFIAQPVVTLWNPFNVRLTVPSFNAYCKWQSLPIYIGCGDGVGYSVSQHVGTYFPGGVTLRIGGGADITLDPGQTRVFAMNDGALVPVPLTGGGGTYNLTPGYVASGRSGWQMMLPPGASPAGSLRYTLSKNIDNAALARDGIYYDYYPANYKYSPVRFSFVGTTTAQFLQLYGQDNPYPFQQSLADAAAAPRAFATFAFGLRLSNDGVSQYNARTGVKTVSKGFLQASPFTTYTEIGQKSAEVLTAYPYASSNVADPGTVSMAGQIGATNPGAFYSSSNSGVQYAGALNPINAPYDLYFLPMTGFADLNGPQSDPTSNYGGFILTGLDPTTGLQRAAVAELPVKPVQSIPGLQGCDIRATNPAPPFHYGLIGNADASPILPPDDAVGRWIDQAGNLRSRDEVHQAFLQHDDSYCLNHVLFDDWFFSSVAPLPADWPSLYPSTGAEHVWNPSVMDSMKKNWASFAAGATTLPNAWFLPNSTAATFDLAVTGQGAFNTLPPQPVAYQRVAATLRVPGQFNVNSTSVVAWRALLGNLRSTSVPYIKPGNSSASLASGVNNPLSRMAVSHEGPSSSGGSSGAVLGFAALTDAQLERLAVEIVKQVKLRGPFLSLSEFVNRQLAAPQPSNPLDPSLSGALGTALKALENAGSSLNPAEPAKNVGKTTSKVGDFGGLEQQLPLGDWTSSSAGAKGDYLHPKAAEGSSTFGFPGWPRQAEVLDRLSPVISVRDETFVVRALGTSPLVNGATAKVWCEAVYQRLPEYVDASVPAHEAPLGDVPSVVTPNLHRVNVVLGRRVRLVSFRWLSPKEL